MANCSSTSRVGVLVAVFLMSVLIFQCQLGKADEDVGGNGSWRSSSSSSNSKISSSNSSDPAQIVAKAMQCFNNKTIYRNCDEEMRLNESGSLVIRPMSAEEMEGYCKGACFMETNLVFNCVQGIMNNFRFYNNATVNDVKNSLKEACTSTTVTNSPSATGNVQVAPKHLQASQTSGISAASCSLYAITYMMAIQAFLTW